MALLLPVRAMVKLRYEMIYKLRRHNFKIAQIDKSRAFATLLY